MEPNTQDKILEFFREYLRLDGIYCGGVTLPSYRPEIKCSEYAKLGSKEFKYKCATMLWESLAYKLAKHLDGNSIEQRELLSTENTDNWEK